MERVDQYRSRHYSEGRRQVDANSVFVKRKKRGQRETEKVSPQKKIIQNLYPFVGLQVHSRGRRRILEKDKTVFSQ